MGAEPHITREEPVQSCGSYRAWQLHAPRTALADLAWHSCTGHAHRNPHYLLPFCEPSLAIRRRFDAAGNTGTCDIVMFPAAPDGCRYDPKPGEELFAFRLSPENLVSLTGSSGDRASGTLDELPLPLRQALADTKALAESGRWHAAWSAMAKALRHLSEELPIDRAAFSAALARRSAGGLTPAEIAAIADVSPRHLRRVFVERIGLSPRALVRRLRLTAAVLEAELDPRPDWAGIAAAHRFADQSHLIRTCQQILGESPRRLHARRRAMAGSSNHLKCDAGLSSR